MAIDRAVDSAALESQLTAIADAIRAKAGATEEMAFPDGFTAAIAAIETGGGLPEGISAMAAGVYTPTSNVTNFSVTHGLGVIPMFAAAFALDDEALTYASSANSVIAWVGRTDSADAEGRDIAFARKSSSTAVSGTGVSGSTSSYPVTTSKYTFATHYSSSVFEKGQSYFWMVGAADGIV